MNRWLKGCIGLLPALALGQTTNLPESNTTFAFHLYRQVAEPGKNVFFSPYNISSAMAMAYAGARGQTAQEMAAVMHITTPAAQLLPAFRELENSLQAGDRPYQLHTANRVWGERQAALLPPYLNLLEHNFGAALERLDFRQQPEPSRLAINDWVKQKTQGKITDLLPSGSIKPITRLVLTTAIYFKSDWAKPFDKKQTTDELFYLKPGNGVRVPMMHASAQAGYFEEELATGLQLPYKGDRLSMIVLLPKQPDGMAALEKALTPSQLTKWRTAMHTSKVQVSLPRFQMTEKYDLISALEALGMKQAFTSNADFTGMTKEKIAISRVVHKAFVDVNEQGTEAAAATGMVAELTAFRKPTIFRADRPFLFLIQDNQSGTILFLGRVMDPR
ncbi:MAG: serpin family protein [Bryobacterales bacterium]|nr:serpin family protein [Bryobacterales bacterium]